MLSRLSSGPALDVPSPVRGDIFIEERDGRTFSSPSASELRLRSRRGKDRLRSVSPTPSRTLTGSHSSRVSRRRDREGDSGSPFRSLQASSPQGSDLANAHKFDTPDIGGQTLIGLLLPPADKAYPAKPAFPHRWSRWWIANTVIHFKNPRAEWRMRAWLIREPHMTVTTLLSKAITSHILFSLETPSAVVPLWARPARSYSVWEVEAGEYYTGVSQARPITHNVMARNMPVTTS